MEGRKPEDGPFKDKKLWTKKQIKKLLLIVIVADLEQFTDKGKLIIYI